MSTYTILSADYANAENTAATIMTEAVRAKAVSEADTAALWEEMLAWTRHRPTSRRRCSRRMCKPSSSL